MEETKHAHTVIDRDLPFVIDPITKKVSSQGGSLVVPQHAKNSERFTFTIPDRYIEGHDMSDVNQAYVHFRNIGAQGQVNAGIYIVKDLSVEEDSVTLSWLIDDDATAYAGALIFSIHFICTDADGAVVYDLPTLTYAKISVGETVWNAEEIVKKYPDIIAELDARVKTLEAGGGGGNGGSSAVSYLYNGVELPKIPKEVTAYPYVVLQYLIADNPGTILAYGYAEKPYTESYTQPIINKTYDRLRVDSGEYRAGNWYSTIPDEWHVTEVGNVTDAALGYHVTNLEHIIWANFDIYASDGTVYLPKTAPVPVTSGGSGLTVVDLGEQVLDPDERFFFPEDVEAKLMAAITSGMPFVWNFKALVEGFAMNFHTVASSAILGETALVGASFAMYGFSLQKDDEGWVFGYVNYLENSGGLEEAAAELEAIVNGEF